MPRPAATLLLSLALAACGGEGGGYGGSGRSSNFPIEGRWEGRLTQQGLAPFTVTATIRDLRDPNRNTVRYSGIDCGGNWSYAGRDGDAFVFRELIDRGAGGDCKGTGKVTLQPAGRRLRYEFSGGGVRSRGMLVRVG